jgi:hypothetical protein
MADISLQRHLFTEAFAYDLKVSKPNKTFAEITRVIPILSFPENTAKFIDSFKDRIKWESDKHQEFDEEFSNYRLFRYAVHAIGLGILFVPIRIIATYMKSYDKKHGRECPYDSPYFPGLDPNYTSPPNFKMPTSNQMFDFEPLRKYGVDPDNLKENVMLRIEFERWKSTQNR